MIKEPRYISFLTLQALHTQTLLGTFDNHFCNYSVSPSGCGKATGATTHYNSSFLKIPSTFTVSILVELPVLSVKSFVDFTLRTCRASKPIGAAYYVLFVAAEAQLRAAPYVPSAAAQV